MNDNKSRLSCSLLTKPAGIAIRIKNRLSHLKSCAKKAKSFSISSRFVCLDWFYLKVRLLCSLWRDDDEIDARQKQFNFYPSNYSRQ